MALNRIQFQPGLNLRELNELYEAPRPNVKKPWKRCAGRQDPIAPDARATAIP
jgi:hypothetical protein